MILRFVIVKLLISKLETLFWCYGELFSGEIIDLENNRGGIIGDCKIIIQILPVYQ